MRIFISYRRVDSQANTDRIHDVLEDIFGKENVFQDVYNIKYGQDFRQALQAGVSSCDVLLVVIGRSWLNIKEIEPSTGLETDQRRLDNPDDSVRIEIETGINRATETVVIPVLVNDAPMPHRDGLPDTLKPLAYLNAAPMRNNPNFDEDMERLIKRLKEIELEKTAAHAAQNAVVARATDEIYIAESAPTTTRAATPSPAQPATTQTSIRQPVAEIAVKPVMQPIPQRSRLPLIAGIGAVAALVVIGLIVRNVSPPDNATAEPTLDRLFHTNAAVIAFADSTMTADQANLALTQTALTAVTVQPTLSDADVEASNTALSLMMRQTLTANAPIRPTATPTRPTIGTQVPTATRPVPRLPTNVPSSPTLTYCQIAPADVSVNIREYPGILYAIVGAHLSTNAMMRVTGYSLSATNAVWYRVNFRGSDAWISDGTSVSRLEGACELGSDAVPYVSVTFPTPTPTMIDMTPPINTVFPIDLESALNFRALPIYGKYSYEQFDVMQTSGENYFIGGGTYNVQDDPVVGVSCGGYTSLNPTVTISDFPADFTGRTLVIVFTAYYGVTDATLLLNDPEREWQCDDDSAGDLNPLIRAPALAGEYDIWIANLRGIDPIEGTLEIFIE